jgi:uncharacterized damage-inducible protein DinB
LPTDTKRPFLSVEPLPTYELTIGRWLWTLEDTRRETKMALANIDQSVLDWAPSQAENSIGTLLYHIGRIELDWLSVEALENAPWPKALKELFPIEDRDDQHVLSVVRNVSLAEHLRRLDILRAHLLASIRSMSLEEFYRPRTFPDYDVTPEWVLHHLIQHEVEHRGHIQMLRSLAERRLEAS